MREACAASLHLPLPANVGENFSQYWTHRVLAPGMQSVQLVKGASGG